MAIVDFQIFYIIGEASPDGPPGATLECNSTVFYRSSIIDIYTGQWQFDWANDGIPYGIMLEVIPYVTRDGSAEFNNPITTSTAPSKTTDTTADFNSTFKLIDGAQAFLDGLGATLNATANVTRDFEVDLFVNTYVNAVFVNLVSSLDMFARGDKNVVEFESNPNVTSSLYAKVGKLTGFGGASVPITPSVVTSTISTGVHLDAIPSYPATIDLAALGLSIPEGTNVTFNIGRGFVRDKTPNQQPIPAFPSWLSFRTAKEGIVPIAAEFDVTSSVGGIYPIALDNIASNFSLLAEPYRVRPFISLQVLQSDVTTFANIITDVFAVIPVTTTIESDVNITTDIEATFVSSPDLTVYSTVGSITNFASDIVSTLQISPIENWRYRHGTSDITVNSQVITDAERFLGLIEDLIIESQVSTAPNYTSDITSDLDISGQLEASPQALFTTGTDIVTETSVSAVISVIRSANSSLTTEFTLEQLDSTIMVWDTLNTTGDTAELIINNAVGVVSINWGDGLTDYYTGSNIISHSYTTPGIYEARIDGNFDELSNTWQGSVINSPVTLRPALVKLKAWGHHGATSLRGALSGSINLTEVDNLITTSVTDISGLFVKSFGFDQDISAWDVSSVTNMSYMFESTDFNQPLATWDVSSVTDMSGMFGGSKYNQPLDSWDISSVTDMSGMFRVADFNQPLLNWDVSSVTDMSYMFSSAQYNKITIWSTPSLITTSHMFDNSREFNSNISLSSSTNLTDTSYMFFYAEKVNSGLNIDTSNVTNMKGMFEQAKVFEASLSGFNTSSVTDMSDMFRNALFFNGAGLNNWVTTNVTDMSYMFDGSSMNTNIDSWDVSSVTDMSRMFGWCPFFNQPLASWDVSSVTNMLSMFQQATSFNQDLNSWDTSNVTDMSEMFEDATSFNGDIFSWDTSNVTSMSHMFSDAESFNGYMNNWDVSSVTVTMGMFSGATSFNQDMNNWNTSSFRQVNRMFKDTTSFNGNITNWDTTAISNETDMNEMFYNATAFNQDLSGWCMSDRVPFKPYRFDTGATAWVLPRPEFGVLC